MLFLKKQNQTDALTIDFIFIQIVKNHCAQGDSARIRASAPYHAKTPKYPFVTFKKFGRKFGHLLYIYYLWEDRVVVFPQRHGVVSTKPIY